MVEEKLLISWSDIVKQHPELADNDPAIGINWDIGQEMVFVYVTFLALF
ncbi:MULTISPECIES: hypothetical protein [unclassified Dehalobacter]|nr:MULTISPECIES: hypothetical protein [unclassified Dehalobacter]